MAELVSTGGIADSPADVPLLDREWIFSGRIWDVRRDSIEFGKKRLVREYLDHPGAVAIVALDERERVFLIKQYRHPVRSREWEIPAGLLDIAGEDPLAAAKRELAEEADLEATSWAVLTDFLPSPGSSNEVIRIYLARGLRPLPEAFVRDDEEADMETRWLGLDDCVDAVLARRVRNASLTLGVLAGYAARGRGWATLAPADSAWPVVRDEQ